MRTGLKLLMGVTAFVAACSETETISLATTSTVDIFATTTSLTQVEDVPLVCDSLTVKSPLGTVDDVRIVEASGLVYGNNDLWVHNDSGSTTDLYRLNSVAGVEQRVVVDESVNRDVEAIAFHDGAVWLADIGDNINTTDRESVEFLKFTEPEPQQTAAQAEVFEFVYSDGPRDAEAFFIDPISGQFYIIDKPISIASVFGLDAIAGVYQANFESAVLERIGEINLGTLDNRATNESPGGEVVPVQGVATGADISPDGSMIALRTYQSLWLFERETGESVVQALQGVPCEAPIATEPQGETVAFGPGPELELVTLSEGIDQPLNLVAQR